MQDKADRIVQLILKYLREEITETGQKELDAWINAHPENRAFWESVREESGLQKGLSYISGIDTDTWWKKIRQEETPAPSGSGKRIIRTWIMAAVIVAVAVTGIYFLFFNKPIPSDGNSNGQLIAGDILPGSNKADLQLEDGRTFHLDTTAKGIIYNGNGFIINNQNDSVVSYQLSKAKKGENETINYSAPPVNTLTTPKGGQFQLYLPDGTRVWLNADSRIKYPAFFTGDTREVEVSGELYFEVAHNAEKPFIVKVTGNANSEHQDVEVLGTSFNIKAYANEAVIQTTLVEGSIRVSDREEQVVLKPGQQSVITNNANIEVQDADIGKVVAWKNNIFKFDGTSIPVVMRQLERWYNMETVYENGIPSISFRAEISRNSDVAGVVQLMNDAGIGVTIDGRRFIVRQ